MTVGTVARPVCGRCQQQIEPGQWFVTATQYTDDYAMLGGHQCMVHVDCPPVPVRPSFDPLAFIMCSDPECAHLAAAHGMRWDQAAGVIMLDDPDMACTAPGCPCQAFDDTNRAGIIAESVVQSDEQG